MYFLESWVKYVATKVDQNLFTHSLFLSYQLIQIRLTTFLYEQIKVSNVTKMNWWGRNWLVVEKPTETDQ